MRGFSPATADEAQEALRQVFGPTIETMLKAEPGARLGCPSNDKSPKPTANRRNGHAPKTVRASAGEPEVAAPRDRGGPFEPVAAPKGPSGPSDMEGRVMSVHARGMSQRGIAPTVRETRGFPMGAETVSAMTDRVWEELERRRSRPLEPACAFLFVDRLCVPAGKGRGARNAAACVAPGCGLQGRKDVPGLWMDESEGARRRVQTFDELRRRGLEDAVCACAGGVAGLEDGPRSVLPPRRVPAPRRPHGAQLPEVRPPEGGPGVLPRPQGGLRGALGPGRPAGLGGVQGGLVAPPRGGGGLGAQRGAPAVAVRVRLGRAQGDARHQRGRERQRRLPQGGRAGALPRRGRRDEAALPRGQGAPPPLGGRAAASRGGPRRATSCRATRGCARG